MEILLPRIIGLALTFLVAGSNLVWAQNDLNLALSKSGNSGATSTASASSVENNNAGLVASNVNDGNHATRWSSQFADPQSLVINLGSVQPIDRVRIEWESSYGVDFELQVSNDGQFATYTTVKKVTGNVPAARNRDTFINEFSQLGAKGQYIRMVATQRRLFGYDSNGQAIRYGYSIREFEVFSFSNDPTKNLALSQSSSASGTENATLTPDKAFDGNPDTRWSTPYSEYQILQIDLGRTTSISRAYVSWEDAYATDFELQVSSDGASNNWTTFATYTNNQAFYNEVAVTASGQYFRVLAKKGFGSFSIYEFALYSGPSPLPVSLTSFTAVPQGSSVAVAWATATEQNNAGFEVQRATNGVDFTTLGKVPGSINSQTAKTYSYTDATPLRPVGYYRLKQLDQNGRVAYSPVVAVRLAGSPSAAAAFSVYPNPTANQTTLQWEAAAASTGQWRLTTITGQAVGQGNFEVQQGANTQIVDLRTVPAGSYVLTIEAAGQTLRRQLVQKVQ
ncbi:MAG: discoidin domain-containing protein [Janthinobacterium lividum]